MGRDFPPVQTGPGAHPASYKMGTRSFPGVKYGRGVLLTTHPLLVPRSWKSRAIPLPILWATTRPVTGTLYLYLYVQFSTYTISYCSPSTGLFLYSYFISGLECSIFIKLNLHICVQLYRVSHSLPNPAIFFNSNTNEDIATKFEQHVL